MASQCYNVRRLDYGILLFCPDFGLTSRALEMLEGADFEKPAVILGNTAVNWIARRLPMRPAQERQVALCAILLRELYMYERLGVPCGGRLARVSPEGLAYVILPLREAFSSRNYGDFLFEKHSNAAVLPLFDTLCAAHDIFLQRIARQILEGCQYCVGVFTNTRWEYYKVMADGRTIYYCVDNLPVGRDIGDDYTFLRMLPTALGVVVEKLYVINVAVCKLSQCVIISQHDAEVGTMAELQRLVDEAPGIDTISDFVKVTASVGGPLHIQSLVGMDYQTRNSACTGLPAVFQLLRFHYPFRVPAVSLLDLKETEY